MSSCSSSRSYSNTCSRCVSGPFAAGGSVAAVAGGAEGAAMAQKMAYHEQMVMSGLAQPSGAYYYGRPMGMFVPAASVAGTESQKPIALGQAIGGPTTLNTGLGALPDAIPSFSASACGQPRAYVQSSYAAPGANDVTYSAAVAANVRPARSYANSF